MYSILKKEHYLIGKNDRLCYGIISFDKEQNEFYLSVKHSKYCDEINQIIPDNIADINAEIIKKDKFLKYMNEFYLNSPNISLLEFSKECLSYYKKTNCLFNITPSTWKNILTKIRSQNNRLVDIIFKKNKTIDGYQFFRYSSFLFNPFLKKDQISKFIFGHLILILFV